MTCMQQQKDYQCKLEIAWQHAAAWGLIEPCQLESFVPTLFVMLTVSARGAYLHVE